MDAASEETGRAVGWSELVGVRVSKAHGTGNDFVVFTDEDGARDVSPETVAAVCDRHLGLGGDGVIRAVRCRDLPEGRRLLERHPERAVDAVLEIVLALPPHDMGEEVAEERGLLVEQGGEVQGVLRRDELVEPELLRRDRRPVSRLEAVVGIGTSAADPLEDHRSRIGTAERLPVSTCPAPVRSVRLLA